MDPYRRLIGALVALGIVLLVGTVGYHYLVGGSWLDDLYMTVITLSTVGYGEVVPGLENNPAGRLFTVALILVGMGILLYAVSAATAFFVEGQLTDLIRRRKMQKRIEKLDNHTIICGIGTTGVHVAEELGAAGHAFVAIESNQKHIECAQKKLDFPYIAGDATDESVLLRAGIERASGLIIVLSTDKDNLYLTFTCRQINPTLRIVSRRIEAAPERFFRAGADAVVSPNHIGGLRIASELLRPTVVGFLDRMLRHSQGTWRFEEVVIDDDAAAAGQTLGELCVPEKTGVPVLAVCADERSDPTYYPAPDTVLKPGARIIVLAERKQVGRLRQLIASGR